MAYMPPEQERLRPEQALRSQQDLLGPRPSDLLRPPGQELKDAVERRNRAAAAKAEEDARKKIQAIPPAGRQSLELAISRGAELVDQWYAGALQAVGAFRSKLVSDQADVLPALAGNLIWAATSIEVVPAKVLLSFFGATLGTLGTVSPTYDAVIGPVAGSVQTRLNDLRDEFVRRLDVVLLPTVESTGFERFAALDHPKRLELVWNALFRHIPWGEHPTEATKAYVLRNLQQADDAAAAKLKLYASAWRASLKPGGVDFTGPAYFFDAGTWASSTSDPVWLYAGYTPSSLQAIYAVAGDPIGPQSRRDKRAAAVLRIEIERLWPFP